MFVLNFRYIFLFNYLLIIILASCSSTKAVKIEQAYFEDFTNKRIAQGHYGGYFILDGNKRIYKIHLSNNDEIIIESNNEKGQVVYNDIDFLKNLVVIYHNGKMFRVVRGTINLYRTKDKLEVNINVLGIYDLWELISDNIPEINDGNHYKMIVESKLKLKEAL